MSTNPPSSSSPVSSLPASSADLALASTTSSSAAISVADALGSNHPVDVYIQRLRTAVSRQTTERKLDMVARVVDAVWPGSARLDHPRGERYGVAWLALTPIACERLRNALADRWAPATANAALAAIRGVLRAAWLSGAFDADFRDRLFEGLRAVRGDRDYVKASRARPAPSPTPLGVASSSGMSLGQSPGTSPGTPPDPSLDTSDTLLDAWLDHDDPDASASPGRHLGRTEIASLWSVAGGDPKPARGARNLAVCALLYGCGLRAGEAVALTLADVDTTSEEPTVRVFGKGRKRRTVPIPAVLVNAIQRWIVVRGRGPGPLLQPVLKSGSVLHVRASGRPAGLTAQALTSACLFLAKQAGIAPFRAHDLRRTFAGQHLDGGTDIATVAQLMGHASVTTTSRYDRRPDRARREAQDRLWLPAIGGR